VGLDRSCTCGDGLRKEFFLGPDTTFGTLFTGRRGDVRVVVSTVRVSCSVWTSHVSAASRSSGVLLGSAVLSVRWPLRSCRGHRRSGRPTPRHRCTGHLIGERLATPALGGLPFLHGAAATRCRPDGPGLRDHGGILQRRREIAGDGPAHAAPARLEQVAHPLPRAGRTGDERPCRQVAARGWSRRVPARRRHVHGNNPAGKLV
jgi:hypothetical protein